MGLTPVFADMLPAQVCIVEAAPWMWDQPVSAQEEAFILRAVNKRKREFRAGRHAAHSALRALGAAAGDLLPGPQREPLWPPGVCGSITHIDDYCAAAVGNVRHVLALGIDAETTEPLAQESHAIILTETERQRLADMPEPLAHHAPKIIFSAKECIHKVYHPLNRHTLEFTDAYVSLDPEGKRFFARILRPAPREDVPLRALCGRYRLTNTHIFTSICVINEPGFPCH